MNFTLNLSNTPHIFKSSLEPLETDPELFLQFVDDLGSNVDETREAAEFYLRLYFDCRRDSFFIKACHLLVPDDTPERRVRSILEVFIKHLPELFHTLGIDAKNLVEDTLLESFARSRRRRLEVAFIVLARMSPQDGGILSSVRELKDIFTSYLTSVDSHIYDSFHV